MTSFASEGTNIVCVMRRSKRGRDDDGCMLCGCRVGRRAGLASHRLTRRHVGGNSQRPGWCWSTATRATCRTLWTGESSTDPIALDPWTVQILPSTFATWWLSGVCTFHVTGSCTNVRTPCVRREGAVSDCCRRQFWLVRLFFCSQVPCMSSGAQIG